MLVSLTQDLIRALPLRLYLSSPTSLVLLAGADTLLTPTAGIERILRMVQAILMVVLSRPLLTGGFVKLVALGNQHVWTSPRSADLAILRELRGAVALARRFFRMFRFLEAFQAAHMIYASFYASRPALPPAPAASPAASEGNAAKGDENGEDVASTTSPETASGDGKGAEPEKAPATQSKPKCNCKHQHHNHHHHQPTDPNRIPTEAWLDIFSRTFNGMYLVLETLTLLDALQLPGFSLWGAYWAPLLNVEGQRFWFFSLACGIASGVIKVAKLFAYGPAAFRQAAGAGGGTAWGTADDRPESEMAEWERMRAKMRRFVHAQREGRRAWKREIRTRGYRVARRCVADVLDLAVPGSVLGWVRVRPGTVGAAMVVSTWLTGLEVWERCGGQIGMV